MTIVHGAHRPPDGKAREEVDDRRVEDATAAGDDELRRVTDPELVGCVGAKLAVGQIRRDGLVVLAQGRRALATANASLDSFGLHQPDDTLAAHALALLDEHARTAIRLAPSLVRLSYWNAQPSVVLRSLRLRSSLPRVKRCARDAQYAAEPSDRKVGPLRVGRSELHPLCRAKRAAIISGCRAPIRARGLPCAA